MILVAAKAYSCTPSSRSPWFSNAAVLSFTYSSPWAPNTSNNLLKFVLALVIILAILLATYLIKEWNILGIIGILSFTIIWLVKLSSLENLETSYLSPFAPFSKKDQNNAIYKAPEEKLINRPDYISTLNPHRQRRSKWKSLL